MNQGFKYYKMKPYQYFTVSVGKDFLTSQNPEATKEMIDKFDYVKKFAWQKHCNKVKRQLTNWEKLFVTYITDKGLNI